MIFQQLVLQMGLFLFTSSAIFLRQLPPTLHTRGSTCIAYTALSDEPPTSHWGGGEDTDFFGVLCRRVLSSNFRFI